MQINQLELRQQIVGVGKKLHAQGYVVSNDGNISARSGENEILITPSGISKGALNEEMMLRVGFDGTVLSGDRSPSVETPMHLMAYKTNSAVKAVVHAHPYHATLCSILGIALDMPVLAETVIGVGMIPVAAFAIPGSKDLGESIVPFMDCYQGCLLSNHGAITWAESVEKAFYQMEQIEFFAKITLGLLNQNRPPRFFSNEQIQGLLEVKSRLFSGNLRIPEGAAETSNTEIVWPEGVDVTL